ncbi:XdhC family protein [Blautia sp.]|uniref:XdhC family protein n=1 Tax=Blautia sp. TaxID=1955243 RepID=UPI0025B8486D|nr:XdhC/CoxI family protein [Blautia sp.]MCI7450743.1 XdhC family protein [Blautia sp.]MDD6413784.1 XdhC family protein [Blautia sp.]MDY4115350.1 XdhC/CoxI family protein [Blautia sp.]
MYKEIYQILEETGKVKTAMVLNGNHKGEKCLIKEEHCTAFDGGQAQEFWKEYEEQLVSCQDTKVIRIDETDFFVEIYVKNPQLIILGGGHVSQPVAKIGKMLGFHVTVMDDREEFVTKERFPDADRLIQGTYEEIPEKIPVYENAYYVIVTRGHLGDSASARQILKRPYVYLGMIGSRNKVKLTREKLLREGFTEDQLNTIHAPIGLPIGGHMPAEIAVSITAEIVQEKNKYNVSYIDEAVEKAVWEKEKGVMITIISKRGSSPRGTGSKMFLDREGRSHGSIGGGNVEFQALKYAPKAQHGEIKSYNLSNQGGANLGMICGGEVEVLYEIL